MCGDGSVKKLEASGAVLGVFRDWKYDQTEVTLAAGDRVLFYTDGVSEAGSLDGEEFGEDRLTAVLRQNSTSDATSLQEKVMHNVREFCEGNFHDDATVVVLAVTG
jgi:sigma-B regulation protein RsbU (phosphoserine phosphatase)